MFTPKTGIALWVFILGALAFSALVFFAISLTPNRARKPLISAITFLCGLFFALEFFLPVGADGKNFLTDALKPASDFTNVLQAFALGLGVYSLVGLHLKNIVRRRSGWGFSLVLIGAVLAMVFPAILKEYHPNRYNINLYALIFKGAYNNLNAAMFSIVAFYIVSAAYRAFRVRSVEATILLGAAFLIMLGQVAVGQAITAGIPNEGVAASFRVENIANWILTRVNSPAILAVDFGLGVGALATSLRLWLSLERGSYFDKEL